MHTVPQSHLAVFQQTPSVELEGYEEGPLSSLRFPVAGMHPNITDVDLSYNTINIQDSDTTPVEDPVSHSFMVHSSSDSDADHERCGDSLVLHEYMPNTSSSTNPNVSFLDLLQNHERSVSHEVSFDYTSSPPVLRPSRDTWQDHINFVHFGEGRGLFSGPPRAKAKAASSYGPAPTFVPASSGPFELHEHTMRNNSATPVTGTVLGNSSPYEQPNQASVVHTGTGIGGCYGLLRKMSAEGTAPTESAPHSTPGASSSSRSDGFSPFPKSVLSAPFSGVSASQPKPKFPPVAREQIARNLQTLTSSSPDDFASSICDPVSKRSKSISCHDATRDVASSSTSPPLFIFARDDQSTPLSALSPDIAQHVQAIQSANMARMQASRIESPSEYTQASHAYSSFGSARDLTVHNDGPVVAGNALLHAAHMSNDIMLPVGSA